MSEALPTPSATHQRWVRFARVAAGAALVFSVTALAGGQFALVVAAIVCAVIGLVAAAVGRDVYSGAGCLIAGIIAVTSPAAMNTISTMQANQAAAQQAEEDRTTAEIAEVEAFDTHMRAYQPNVSAMDQLNAYYARVTQGMTQISGRLLVARSTNSPDQAAIYSQLTTLANQVDLMHNQVVTMKKLLDQRVAELPGKWSHIQSLCASPKVAAADACGRVRVDYPSYRARVAQVLDALDRENAAYTAEKPRQSSIIDTLGQ
jgi:hypothetical protein